MKMIMTDDENVVVDDVVKLPLENLALSHSLSHSRTFTHVSRPIYHLSPMCNISKQDRQTDRQTGLTFPLTGDVNGRLDTLFSVSPVFHSVRNRDHSPLVLESS